MGETESVGVMDLARSLRVLQTAFNLDEVSATNHLPDGHEITLQWTGDTLHLEREDGEVMLLDGEGIR